MEPALKGSSGLRTSWGASAQRQGMHREISVRIGPHRDRGPAGVRRQRPERVHAVFIAALGMDGLAAGEWNCPIAQTNLLRRAAREVHFDALALAVEEGVVPEAVEIEIGAELAIDAL